MTVALGVMEVPAGTDGDSNRRYLNGTLPDGGLWTALRRLSDHDHTGGHNGAPISLASVPDGSITVDKLDPAVLLPYALTDGSKPFTGQVTMQADAVVRDALYFGQQGTALAPDVTLTRTGAGALRVDTHLGVGVNPSAWDAGARAVQLGSGGTVFGSTAQPSLYATSNTYYDGTNFRALSGTNPSVYALLGAGQFFVATAPSVAAGATQTFTTRASIAPTGTLSLFPDGGAVGLSVGGPIVAPAGVNLAIRTQSAGSLAFGEGATDKFAYYANQLYPVTDNQVTNGTAGQRWTAIYAVSGAVNASSQAFKEGITPLSPERAMQAVRATEAVTFDYVAPTRGPEWYDLPDDPEQAEAVLQQRLTAAPLEAAARHQHGFIAEAADPLFLVGEGQTSPGSSIGVLLAALQNIDQRLAALETP